MPSRAVVEAFVVQVLSGAHDQAILDHYAQDAWMQENQAEPRRGRDALVAGEQKTMARFKAIKTEILGPALIEGDTVAIRWRFTFTPHEGPERAFEEVAWQTWRGDKIATETFFYDPAQMAG